jgi:serpin B
MTDTARFPLGFGADLFTALTADADEHNVVLSPYSVAAALGMALAGARGDTAAQLCTALGVRDGDELAGQLSEIGARLDRAADPEKLIMDVANAVWLQQEAPIADGYRQVLTDDYRAAPRSADFGTDPDGAAEAINSFVADRTRGKITELVDASAFDAMTRLVLVNAAYFRGSWQQPFQGRTRPADFTLVDGSTVQVDMMRQHFDHLDHYADDDLQAISMPFAGGEFAMAVLLPTSVALEDHSRLLTGDRLSRLLHGLRPVAVDVDLPRWQFRTSQELRPQLERLGVHAPFDASTADFGRISDEPLEISQVLHEAYVSVDESGAEAAAATGVAVAARAVTAGQPRQLSFDRPYAFLIFETATATPLFIGRVTDPRSAG